MKSLHGFYRGIQGVELLVGSVGLELAIARSKRLAWVPNIRSIAITPCCQYYSSWVF